jgi:uncharacterized protein (UPF0332 family)
MNFEKLLSEKKIEEVKKSEFDTKEAEKDINFAKKGLEIKNFEWAMTIAYNSVLRTGNKLMNYLGYRAIGKEHHKNLFEFLRQTEINQELVNYFDKVRKKRNDFIYRDVVKTSSGEAEEIIKKAQELVQEIRTFVQKNRTKNKQIKNQ